MIRSTPDRVAHWAIYAAIACERFAYYLVLSGLVLALVDRGHTQKEASALYGQLLFAAYLTPLVGGWLAGKLSLRTMIMLGLGILTSAYLAGVSGRLLPMLGLIAVGCGCFKPCLSTLLSLLYPAGDERKIKALSTYYLWIQLGALPSGLIGGWLRQSYGWAAAYSAAATGAFLAFCAIGLAWARLVPYRTNLDALVGTAVDVEDQGEWKAGHILTVLGGGILFFLANQQQGSTLTFWAESRVDRHGLPAEAFSTLNPLFVGLLTPVLGRFWRSGERTRLISAMVATGLGFLILLVGSRNVSYFVLSYFLGALGELLISPFGMGKITELVPRRHAALGMAGWLLTTSIGGYFAGVFGGLAPEKAALVTAGLCLLGACWLGLRWPERKREVEMGHKMVQREVMA